MGKQFLIWFLAALVGGIVLLGLGSLLSGDGLPFNWGQAQHDSAPTVGSAAGQATLRADTPAAPKATRIFKVGDQVPADYTLPDLDGKPQTLAAYRGKRVLLNFWATWCHPCLKEMPALAAAQKRYAASAQIIGIAMDTPDHVRAWLQHTPVDYPIWQGLNGGHQPTVTFGNTAGLLPYSVLIGPDGRIEATHMGKLDQQRLQQWLGGGPNVAPAAADSVR